MNRYRTGFLALAGLLATLAPPAAAQAFEVGGHATYTKADGADGSWAGGAQARFRFLGFLGAEGLVDYKRTTYSAGGVDTLRVEQYPVQASLMIWLTPRTWPVQFYGLGGGGWYYTRSTFLGPEAGASKHDFARVWRPRRRRGRDPRGPARRPLWRRPLGLDERRLDRRDPRTLRDQLERGLPDGDDGTELPVLKARAGRARRRDARALR